MTPALRLTIELVPQIAWYRNLRTVVSPADWDTLRRRTYAHYQYRCGICGASGRLHCHEVWDYDDEQHVQTLRGFIALCEWCHHVKHLGLAGVLSEQGYFEYERVVAHFLTVNGCDRQTFEDARAQAFQQWHARSQSAWRVEFGEYQDLVERPEPGDRRFRRQRPGRFRKRRPSKPSQ